MLVLDGGEFAKDAVLREDGKVTVSSNQECFSI